MGSSGKRNTDLSNGLFYQPTILVDVTADMRIAKEEVFGPVMVIYKVVESDEDMIKRVNDCPFGLGSAVYSKNATRATKIGEALRCGMTTINDFGANYLVQSLPFGGIKDSGFDRFAGPEGLRGCCLQKSVLVDKFPSLITTNVPSVLQYPVTRASLEFFTGLIELLYGHEDAATRLNGLVKVIKASMSKKPNVGKSA